MTEELKRRLDFEDTAIQLGAANKLYSLVVYKQQTDADIELICAATSIFPELQALWDKCTSSSPSISTACCDALVNLVPHGHAQFGYILTGFINLVPSAENVGGIIHAVGQLLRLQLKGDVESAQRGGNVYECQYGLRSPPHPFISVLNSRPDGWPFLLQEVSNLLQIQYGLSMLKPFLKYVLLDPHQTLQYSAFRSALYTTLIQESSTSQECQTEQNDVTMFLLDSLLTTQLDTPQKLTNVILQMQALSNVVKPLGSHETTTDTISFICNAFALCNKLLTFGLEMTPVLKVITKVIPEGVCLSSDVIFNMWCCLLIPCPPCQINALLELGHRMFIQHEETKDTNWLQPTNKRLMVLPLLRYISTPIGQSVSMETSHRGRNQVLAADVFLNSVNEACLASSEDAKCVDTPCNSIDPWYNYVSCYTKLIRCFNRNHDVAHAWLSTVQSNISSGMRVPDIITTFVAALFLSDENRMATQALDVLVIIATQDTSQAPRMLPLLLYRLTQTCEKVSSDLILPIMNAIPMIATHKVCVGPVLRTLQSLGEGAAALPTALRLITVLWKNQDRVFPHLQKLLSAPDDSESYASRGEPCEILLAKAASIKDVCIHKPNQHGADLLPAISKIIKDCTRDGDATIAALALEALAALCEAEVVDIRTMWEVLAPKLNKDSRPLVLQSLCQLFGLVPSLAVETEEYEEFRCDIVELLWKHSTNADKRIAIAAFQALSNFGEDEFSLDDLPDEVTSEVRAKMAVAKTQRDEKKKAELAAGGGDEDVEGEIEEEEEDEIDVPGSCYVKLLQCVHADKYSGLQKLLVSLVAQEVQSLPRGVHKSAMHGLRQSANQSKALASIPQVLLNKYEKNRQPGLKAALAGGLLFSFEPKLDIGRDGRMARRHLVTRGRAYQQMMITLVNEVTCPHTDWYRLLQNPHGWASYMERTFKALLEGRQAELEMQQSHGHRDDSPQDFQNKLNAVWLWVRDKLTDQLKTAAKGEPVSQGNSLYALTGLALVSTHHFMSLGESEFNKHKPTEHVGQNKWLMMIVETLLSIIDGKHKPKGRFFNWCQQRTSRGMSTASTLAQSSATVALAQLAPLIITLDSSCIYQMIEVLTTGLPGQPTASESPVIQMHHGIALGWLLASLHEEQFGEVTGNEGSIAVLQALHILEETAMKSSSVDATHGAMLGLSLALSAMAKEGAAHVRAHLTSIYSKLVARLEQETELGPYLQAICLCVGSVTSLGYHSNTINPSDAFSAAVKLQTVCQEHSQVPGLAISVGLLFHNLVQGGHPNISPLMANLYSTWTTALDAKGSSSQQKVSAMSGLTTLVMGTGPLYQSGKETSISSNLQPKMAATLKLLTQALQEGRDPGLQSTCPSLLGIAFMASSGVAQTKTGIPSSYSYLPETSILRACLDLLIEGGKLGPERISPDTVCVVLSAMIGKSDSMPALPPVNWAAVLTPLLRLPYGDSVQCLCLKLAMKQCLSQPSAALFIITWISPTLFGSLHETSKTLVYSCLPSLIRTMPSAKLKPFFESTLIEPFTIPGVHTTLCKAVLDGLLSAIKMSDLPQSVPMMVYRAIEVIYGYMPKELQLCHIGLMALLSDCLCHLPGENMDRITDPTAQDNLMKSTFVRSYLVSHGKQELTWINACIDVGMNSAMDTTSILWILLVGFHGNTSSQQHQGDMHRIQWLLELLGHIRNIAYGKIPLSADQTISKAVDFTLHVLCGAVAMWTSPDVALLLGVERGCFTILDDNEKSNTGLHSKIVLGHKDLHKTSVSALLPMLPYSMGNLLLREPWQQITSKVLDWLLVMHDTPSDAITKDHKEYLKATVTALRHTREFKKPAYWTRAFSR